ncbi:MAG: hypothetical protein QOK19_12 [Solirubrobacteraceae bacterium]|jgi:hypothetical protein|nr:hypothetical protein [Solirubrobacterales bacterium]MEA2214451.1 hypothetical protein [Solirubrobacteraceae bacterium]
MPHDPNVPGSPATDPPESLAIERTATGYWSVQRGSVQLAFAMTRSAAEHERETLQRLARCSTRRAGTRSAARA